MFEELRNFLTIHCILEIRELCVMDSIDNIFASLHIVNICY
jgi:hypothetical protein